MDLREGDFVEVFDPNLPAEGFFLVDPKQFQPGDRFHITEFERYGPGLYAYGDIKAGYCINVKCLRRLGDDCIPKWCRDMVRDLVSDAKKFSKQFRQLKVSCIRAASPRRLSIKRDE